MGLSIGEDRPAEALVTLSGTQVAGPALCGSCLVFCTERQAGMYDRDRGRSIVDFPRGFIPMLQPDGGELSLAPASLPLMIDEAEGPARRAWVAGRRGGRSGLLRLDFETRDVSTFRELGEGSSLTTQDDGSTCLCTEEAIEIFGKGAARRVEANLRGWMPASLNEPLLTWFDYEPYPERQKIAIGWNERRFHVEFESRECTSETCCGAYLAGEDMLVCYLNRKAKDDQAGLKFARWCLTERA